MKMKITFETDSLSEASFIINSVQVAKEEKKNLKDLSSAVDKFFDRIITQLYDKVEQELRKNLSKEFEKNPALKQINMTASEINKNLLGGKGSEELVKKVIEERFKISAAENEREYSLYEPSPDGADIKQGRPFMFLRQAFSA